MATPAEQRQRLDEMPGWNGVQNTMVVDGFDYEWLCSLAGRYIAQLEDKQAAMEFKRRIEELEAAIETALPLISRIATNWSDDKRGDASRAMDALSAVMINTKRE